MLGFRQRVEAVLQVLHDRLKAIIVNLANPAAVDNMRVGDICLCLCRQQMKALLQLVYEKAKDIVIKHADLLQAISG